MEKRLTESDIRYLLGCNTKIVTYDELLKETDIERLLQPCGNFVLLYLTGPKTGHWVGVLYTLDDFGDIIIEVYDPYGTGIDDQMDFPGVIKFKNHLSKLLLHASVPASYNQYPHQKWDMRIQTCGRHVVNRLLNYEMTLDEYNDYMRSFGMDLDELVTDMTNIV